MGEETPSPRSSSGDSFADVGPVRVELFAIPTALHGLADGASHAADWAEQRAAWERVVVTEYREAENLAPPGGPQPVTLGHFGGDRAGAAPRD